MPIEFRTLSDEECRAFLETQHVGRLAYTYKQRVDIEPLHFVMDGEWLYLRTAHGSKLAMLAHHPWVALEADDVRALFEWRSVVVHGVAEVLGAESAGADATRWQHAVDVFRRVVPHAFAVGDPTPARDVMLRVHISHITGRAAREVP
jgi:uncharacterized protein